MNRQVAVIAGAVSLDLALGELPNRLHPVAWLGSGIAACDRRLPQDGARARVASGMVLAAGWPLLAVATGAAIQSSARRLPGPLGVMVEAVALKQAFAIRALFAHAEAVRTPLAEGDTERARHAVGAVVSRDTGDLDETDIASAAIESLTENASDSVVAPLVWYLAGGLPAAMAYRTVNTLDAMVGYHHRGGFGAPSARLDDAANWIPARLTAAAFALASGRRQPKDRRRQMRDDARSTSSPNSGWPMAFAAHALGVRLEKPGHHRLNDSDRAPHAEDIATASILVRRALGVVVASALVLAGLRGGKR